MKSNSVIVLLTIVAILSLIMFLYPMNSFSHCDTMDGPVIKAAQKALDTRNVKLVLIWVQKKDEVEIEKAFQKTLAVRKLSLEAKEFADMYFFETLVRIHRAGEGAPYTGIEPAGLDLGPAIPAADKAIETGSIEQLLKLLTDNLKEGLNTGFKEVIEKKNYNKDDVEAGREYVKAYIEFVHYVEKVYESTKGAEHTVIEESEHTEKNK